MQSEQVALSSAMVGQPTAARDRERTELHRAWRRDRTYSVSTANGRLAADIRPVHQHAVTGCGCTYCGCAYRRSSHDRSTSRSARNAGHAHRRPGPADPGLRASCKQRETVVLRPVHGTENPADDNGGNQKCSFQADSFHSNLPCSQQEHLPTNLPILDLFHGQSCGAIRNPPVFDLRR
jgi:hypothetical protein